MTPVRSPLARPIQCAFQSSLLVAKVNTAETGRFPQHRRTLSLANPCLRPLSFHQHLLSPPCVNFVTLLVTCYHYKYIHYFITLLRSSSPASCRFYFVTARHTYTAILFIHGLFMKWCGWARLPTRTNREGLSALSELLVSNNRSFCSISDIHSLYVTVCYISRHPLFQTDAGVYTHLHQ